MQRGSEQFGNEMGDASVVHSVDVLHVERVEWKGPHELARKQLQPCVIPCTHTFMCMEFEWGQTIM